MKNKIEEQLQESARVKQASATILSDHIALAAQHIIESYKNGGMLLIAGNGGSAADAQHIAAEFIGKFKQERRALPALALATNMSAITAIGNDYAYDAVFARHVEAFVRHPHDVLLVISTSGNSKNLLEAVNVAKKKGIFVIGLLGRGGGQLAPYVDNPIVVPSDDTQRIQEAHIAIGHIMCGLIEEALFPETLS